MNKWVGRALHVKIKIQSGQYSCLSRGHFDFTVDMKEMSENSNFPFERVTVTPLNMRTNNHHPFERYYLHMCTNCSEKGIEHRRAYFRTELKDLTADGLIIDGELKLEIAVKNELR